MDPRSDSGAWRSLRAQGYSAEQTWRRIVAAREQTAPGVDGDCGARQARELRELHVQARIAGIQAYLVARDSGDAGAAAIEADRMWTQ